MFIFNTLINTFILITNTFTQPYILTYSHTFTNTHSQTHSYRLSHTYIYTLLHRLAWFWYSRSEYSDPQDSEESWYWQLSLALPYPGEFPECPRNPSSHCPLPSASYWWVPPSLPSSVPLPWSISHCSLEVDHCLLQLGHLTVFMDLAKNINQC